MFEEDIYNTKIRDNYEVTTIKITDFQSFSALMDPDGRQIGTVGPEEIPRDYNPDTDGYTEIRILDNHLQNVITFTGNLQEYKNNDRIENDEE